MNRSILTDMLGDEYEIIEAEDGAAAIAALHKHLLNISLVLLDVVMPHVDGFEVLNVMNQRHWIEDIPVIIISAESGSSQVKRAYELGVTDFIARPFDTLVVRRRVINTILLYAKQKQLIGMLADQIYEKEHQSSMMVDILSHIVEFRNNESGLHIIRVRTLTDIFLQQLQRETDKYQLTAADISRISTASALHDIGKIAIKEDILNKPGRLTDEEFEIIKTHSLVGAEMLKALPAFENEPLVKTAYEICRWHHERYDGRGYPDGLSGDDIPISAQIVALADVYDALTSDRCYKKAYTHETAVQMILDGQCGKFNPLLTDCLQDVASVLPEELANAAAKSYRPELRRLSSELTSKKIPIASERSLQLLDHERMKYNFFAAMTEEIQFEYTVAPDILTLSGWGAKKLDLDEVILNPWHNEVVLNTFGEDTVRAIQKMLRATTPEHPVITYECTLNYNGQLRWHRFIARAIWSSDESPVYTGSIGKFMDIHDSYTELKNLKLQASHDILTGLLNHAYAKERIKAKLTDKPETVWLLAIMDLDRFKHANDNYGHIFGDQVLKHVAQKLRKNISNNDIVARVGGDEFLLFLESRPDVGQEFNNIISSVSGQFDGFYLSASMGVASTADVGNDYEDLFHAADQALYHIKRQKNKGQWCYFDESMQKTLTAISPIDQTPKGE